MTKQRKQQLMLVRIKGLKCVWSTLIGLLPILMVTQCETLHASIYLTLTQTKLLLIAPRSVTPIALAAKYYFGRIIQGDYEFS